MYETEEYHIRKLKNIIYVINVAYVANFTHNSNQLSLYVKVYG